MRDCRSPRVLPRPDSARRPCGCRNQRSRRSWLMDTTAKFAAHAQRETAYGQSRPPRMVDKLGVWLGAREVMRNATFAGARFGDFGCGFNATFARSQLGVAASAVLVDLALAEDLKR